MLLRKGKIMKDEKIITIDRGKPQDVFKTQSSHVFDGKELENHEVLIPTSCLSDFHSCNEKSVKRAKEEFEKALELIKKENVTVIMC